MAPVIHLVRHAQGYHNLRLENQWMRDPDLTDLGKKQCSELRNTFPYHDKLTHLIASPLRRTIYTCKLSFGDDDDNNKEKKKKKKIIALQDAQEVSLYPCDVGTDKEKLKEEFGDDEVDFSLVGGDWNDKSPESDNFPEPGKLETRTRRARLWLRDLVKQQTGDADEDAHVVLVTHGGILHFITEDWRGIASGHGTGWQNTEYRSYEFADKTGQDPNASLKELPESINRRGAHEETEPTDAEMRAMRDAFENNLAEEVQVCLEKISRQQQQQEAAA
ncbi:histidine phosphatase superfamily [Poronia punctata]|nr:histidine phosphatase superfamily [Poronia punctata]